MRSSIIRDIAIETQKEEQYITELLNKNFKYSSYITKTFKNNKKVIDKQSVSEDDLIVFEYYKSLINRYYNVLFPNRTYIMTELMNLMPYLHRYNKYTIYKFDFKNFFYNIDPKKTFNYINNEIELKPNEYRFFKKYTSAVSEFVPGIGLHNSLVEVNGKQFDNNVRNEFLNYGFLYFARYVDDCILILDENVSESIIQNKIIKTMHTTFGNEMNLNSYKTEYVTSEHTNYQLDYLGYVFEKGQSSHQQFSFGIADKKLQKYKRKIDRIILEYSEHKDIEILNLKLDLMFKRIVYLGDRNGNRKFRWQVRGLSDSYKELKRFMDHNADFSKINQKTTSFFKHYIRVSFNKNKIKIPPKINNQLKNNKHISNFINNRALLLNKKIGMSYKDLKITVKIFENGNLENFSYSDLVNKLLVKINE